MRKLGEGKSSQWRSVLTGLSLAALLWLPVAFSQAADSAPRGIADITSLLHQYKPDLAKVAAAQAVLQRKAPEAASKR